MQKRAIYLVYSGVLLSIFALAVSLFLSRGMAKHFVLDGVYFDGRSLAGMSYEEAGELIDGAYVDLSKAKVTIKVGDIERDVPLADLGVGFDTRKTLQAVKDFSYGRNLFTHIQTRVTGMRGGEVKVQPVFDLPYSQFESAMYDFFPEIQPAREAKLVVSANAQVEVLPHHRGILVNLDQTYGQLREVVKAMDLVVVEPHVEIVPVDYTTEDALRDKQILEWFFEKEVKLINPQYEYEHTVRFQPDWVEVRRGNIVFQKNQIARYLEQFVALGLDVYKQDLEIVEVPEAEVGHVDLKGEVRDGYRVHVASTVENMVSAFASDRFAARVEVVETKGGILNSTDTPMGKFELLAQGRSNFKGSTAGRAFNVQKGLNEKMNNILIAPGATFDFNSFLGPVTYGAGWKEALAIFNGEDLEPVAGGGLCQVSTTVYRAALNAGFEILEQRNHSLYVHYYREFGNGLDATIYPGQQNLKFVNNSGNYVLLRAWVDGNDAYVNFYGTDDGRKVELVGPIYAGGIPEEYRDRLTLGGSQIAWIQKIVWANGEKAERIIKSSYKNSIMR